VVSAFSSWYPSIIGLFSGADLQESLDSSVDLVDKGQVSKESGSIPGMGQEFFLQFPQSPDQLWDPFSVQSSWYWDNHPGS
jgi:hypothetical protein